MPRSSVRATLAVTLLTTAFSQPAAMVDLKGQNSYSRSHYNEGKLTTDVAQASAPEPARFFSVTPMPTQTPVAVQTVSSTDLAPPTAAPAKVASNPKPAAAKPVTVAQAAPVNHWTNKPHEQEQVIAQAPQAAPAKAAPAVVAKPTMKTAAAQPTQGFIWPVNGKKVISGFGPKAAGKVNDGINIAADNGEPVWAAADGEVVYVGNELQGYGNMVLIKHTGSKTTTYAHLGSTTVEKYDRIKQGDIIGYVGSTGNVKEPQLHFAIRDGKDPVDPRKYLATKMAGL